MGVDYPTGRRRYMLDGACCYRAALRGPGRMDNREKHWRFEVTHIEVADGGLSVPVAAKMAVLWVERACWSSADSIIDANS